MIHQKIFLGSSKEGASLFTENGFVYCSPPPSWGPASVTGVATCIGTLDQFRRAARSLAGQGWQLEPLPAKTSGPTTKPSGPTLKD